MQESRSKITCTEKKIPSTRIIRRLRTSAPGPQKIIFLSKSTSPSSPLLETQPLPVNSLSVPCSRDHLIESLLSRNKRSTSRGEIVERAKLSFEFSNTVDVPRGRTGSLPLRNSLIQIVQSEVDKKNCSSSITQLSSNKDFYLFFSQSLLLTL